MISISISRLLFRTGWSA